MNKQLSRFYVGAGKASTRTPRASGWLLIRMGLQLIGQHIRTQVSNLFYRAFGIVAAVVLGLIGVAAMLVLCALFLVLCFAVGWIADVIINGIIHLIELLLP